MLEYALRQKVNPRDLTAARKFYAVAQPTNLMEIRDLAQWISRVSTMSTADTLGVLEALLELMPEFLLDGKSIKLGDLGTFRAVISSDGVELEDDWDVSMIRRLNVRFRPGKVFQNRVDDVVYRQIEG